MEPALSNHSGWMQDTLPRILAGKKKKQQFDGGIGENRFFFFFLQNKENQIGLQVERKWEVEQKEKAHW